MHLVGCRHCHWRVRFFLCTKFALRSFTMFLRCVFYNQGVDSHHALPHLAHTLLNAVPRLNVRLFTNSNGLTVSPCRSTPLYLDFIILLVFLFFVFSFLPSCSGFCLMPGHAAPRHAAFRYLLHLRQGPPLTLSDLGLCSSGHRVIK